MASPEPQSPTEPGQQERPPLKALVLDSIGVWAFVALAITLLFCVWATLIVLSQWTGPMPGVSP